MIVLGLLVLLGVGGLAVSRITARGGAHSPPRPGQLGYHLPGQGSRLFSFGLVLAAAAVSTLVSMVVGSGAARPAGGTERDSTDHDH